jgi:Ribosomal protein L4/L1 family
MFVVLAEQEDAAARSFRNLAGVAVREADAVGVSDLLGAASAVFSQVALEAVTARAKAPSSRAGGVD